MFVFHACRKPNRSLFPFDQALLEQLEGLTLESLEEDFERLKQSLCRFKGSSIPLRKAFHEVVSTSFRNSGIISQST